MVLALTLTLPSEEFLDGFWRDSIAVFGSAGVLLTAIGLFLGWRQLKKTATSAEAALEASKKSIERHNKFLAQISHRLITDSKTHARNDSFGIAAEKLNELADLLLQIENPKINWSPFVERVSGMEESFHRIDKGKITFSDSLRGKWNKLATELRSAIASTIDPFADLKKEVLDESE